MVQDSGETGEAGAFDPPLRLWLNYGSPAGLVAQLVEQRTENPRVGGSTPSQATSPSTTCERLRTHEGTRLSPICPPLEVTSDPEVQHAFRQAIIDRDRGALQAFLGAASFVIGEPKGAVQVETTPSMSKLVLMALQEANKTRQAERERAGGHAPASPSLPPGAWARGQRTVGEATVASWAASFARHSLALSGLPQAS
jgi:hypothetical protein